MIENVILKVICVEVEVRMQSSEVQTDDLSRSVCRRVMKDCFA